MAGTDGPSQQGAKGGTAAAIERASRSQPRRITISPGSKWRSRTLNSAQRFVCANRPRLFAMLADLRRAASSGLNRLRRVNNTARKA